MRRILSLISALVMLITCLFLGSCSNSNSIVGQKYLYADGAMVLSFTGETEVFVYTASDVFRNTDEQLKARSDYKRDGDVLIFYRNGSETMRAVVENGGKQIRVTDIVENGLYKAPDVETIFYREDIQGETSFEVTYDTTTTSYEEYIDDDDYECSVCHRRFRRGGMVCPYCGARFSGRVTDEAEFDEEEDELEAWDEEDGL